MHVIPNEILLLSQIFGIFPLQYKKNKRGELSITCSSSLLKWSLFFISFLSIGSYLNLYLELTAFADGRKSHILSVTSAVAAFMNHIPSNIMVVVLFTSSYRNYPKYIEMSNILDNIDETLKLETRNPRINLTVVFCFIFLSPVIGFSFYKDFHKNPFYCFNSYLRMFYLIQAALFVHFNFVIQSLTSRFRMINKKIKSDVMRPSLLQLMTDLALPLESGASLAEYKLEILIDSYSRLCEAVKKGSLFLESQLFATICCSVIHNIVTLYYFFYYLFLPEPFAQIRTILTQGAWVIIHLSHITLLFWPGTALTDATKETAQIICQLIGWETNNAKVNRQLETFLFQLLHSNVGFTGLGIFRIHGDILTSIASSITTFLVIMLQF